MNLIQPRILKGTRDFGPAEMAKRNFVEKKIREVFERFGYDSIETPVLEYAETILGKYGAEGDKLTYHFKDHGDRHIALRYDQTVPFARYYAANHSQLPSPFKRYEINRVWRADKPQKGRYREFYQCDVDIIGTDSILAELELCKIISDALLSLGFKGFEIRINDRGLIDSILDGIGIDQNMRKGVLIALDKLDKIGPENVLAEFSALGVTELQCNELMMLLDRTGTNADKLARFEGYATKRVSRLIELWEACGGDPSVLQFDISLARGLDYYTGIIYETVIPDSGLGSVAGGGRYENLCGMFSKQKFSGVGISLGFDRLVDAMEILGLFSEIGINSRALVTVFDEDSLPHSINLYDELHEAGVNVEIYFDYTADLSKQLKYADKKGVPYVLVIGPEEVESRTVQVKNMQTGEQKSVKNDELAQLLLSH